MHAEGLDPDWYVTRHRTRDEVLPVGPHRRRPAPRLPLGRLAGGPGRARAPRLPVDSLLRLRGVHRLRPRARGGLAARARGRQPGHGPGPERRGAERPGPVPRRRSRSRRPPAGGPVMRGGAANPVRLRYTKRGQGPLDLAPRRRPRARAGVPDHAAPARVHRGLLAPAEGELRVGAVDRARERRGVPRPRVRRRGRPRAAAGAAHRGVARRHGCHRRGRRSRSGRRRCKKR